MPELPEVETTRLAVSSYLVNQTIKQLVTRHHQLRLPIAPEMQCAVGQEIVDIVRRGKYLLLHLTRGYLLIHLGMSGHLRIVPTGTKAGPHDHIDLEVTNDLILRYNDPRRFGLWLYLPQKPYEHALLAHLGVEPLTDDFDGEYLRQRAHNKKQPMKSFIMNNSVVVGVGNIYASESLFLAGIHPLTEAGKESYAKLKILSSCIKKVLQQAIELGGTTLRDFYGPEGKPGYFANKLNVYGRSNQPCYQCQHIIKALRIAGRNSYYCPQCQPLIGSNYENK
jgi:formamidopyrimidine-DNA glycosylase